MKPPAIERICLNTHEDAEMKLSDELIYGLLTASTLASFFAWAISAMF